MTLTLQIENHEILDDGGPASVTVPDSGLQAGRSAGMGWVLPDSSRHISGHHFDVFRQGDDWFLRDVSTNGTFLQGQRYRLDGPHRLSDGERFQVGHYLILVRISGAGVPAMFGAGAAPMAGGHGAPIGGLMDDPWAVGGGRHAPIDPLPPVERARRGDDFVHDFISDRGLSASSLPPSAYAPENGGAWLAQPDHDASALSPAAPPGLPPAQVPSLAPQAPTPQAPAPQFPAAPPPPPEPQSGPAALAATGFAPGAGAIPPAPGDRPEMPPQHPAVTPDDAVVRAFCRGAGLPPDLYGNVPAEALALALGQALRHVSREVMLALQDRAAAKHFARTGERTMRGATDNNPLKFLPDPGQALETMFLRPRAGFQSGPDSLDEALKDLRLHQAALFAALQPALARLVGDLAPEAIEAEADKARITTNRKAKAWEIYVQRWDARTAPHENGILDEFLRHFSDAYREMVARAQAAPGDPTGR